MAETNSSIDALPTPCLLLDRARLERNAERMRAQASALGISLRPHLKTAKSVDAARFVLGGAPGPATVSTLKEAEVFGKAGITDLLYAVSVTPQKLPKVVQLRRDEDRTSRSFWTRLKRRNSSLIAPGNPEATCPS